MPLTSDEIKSGLLFEQIGKGNDLEKKILELEEKIRSLNDRVNDLEEKIYGVRYG